MKYPERQPSIIEILYASLPQALQDWIATQINNYFRYQHSLDLDREVREDLSGRHSHPHQDV